MTVRPCCLTKRTIAHHLRCVTENDLENLLSDYSEDSVLYTQDGPIRGLKALREFFVEFFATIPPGFVDEFEMLRQDVEGELAYLVWRSGEDTPLGTDTFIVREGKIAVQTFAAYIRG